MQLALRGKCDSLCIVSSDRDFVALTTFLKAEGIAVYGFGRASTDNKYRQSCAKFFEISVPTAPSQAKPASQPTPATQAKPTPQPTPAAKPKPASQAKLVPPAGPPTGTGMGPNLPVILQEIARLADNEGWISLQTLSAELGRRGIRPKDNGGANWAKVFAALGGFETRKDEKGRRSVRVAMASQAAA